MNIISCIALSNTCSKQSDWQLKIFQPITELKTSVGSGPGLVALGGDLLLRGIEFKSQPQKLDELFAENCAIVCIELLLFPVPRNSRTFCFGILPPKSIAQNFHKNKRSQNIFHQKCNKLHFERFAKRCT